MLSCLSCSSRSIKWVCVCVVVVEEQVTYYISQGKNEDDFFYLNAARFLKSLTLSFLACWITPSIHIISLSHTLVIKLVYTVTFSPSLHRIAATLHWNNSSYLFAFKTIDAFVPFGVILLLVLAGFQSCLPRVPGCSAQVSRLKSVGSSRSVCVRV